MTERRVMMWREFEEAIFGLYESITMQYDPDVIIGVARGGLPGAVYLSHLLDAELEVMSATHYEDGEPVDQGVELHDSPPWLVVDALIFDDVVDKGDTMEAVWSNVDQQAQVEKVDVQTATIHVKPQSHFEPDHWMELTDEWIVYPWEEL